MNSKGEVPWNVKEYIDKMSKKPTGRNEVVEARLMKKKECSWGPEIGGTPGLIREPRVVVDAEGNIL